MPSRFTFGGDEHLLVECADEMSLRAFFKSLSAAELIKKSSLRGLDEINAGNYRVGRFERSACAYYTPT